jgi:hypothetical protein
MRHSFVTVTPISVARGGSEVVRHRLARFEAPTRD